MEAIAKTKYLKGSPRKARLVIDMIRGINVSRALSILKFTDKRAADPIAQCLNSAIANATFKAEQQNIAIDPDDLWVRTCFVDMGPTKGRSRMRPAPQGRAYRERRHYCHITIEVTSEERTKSEEMFKLDAARAERIAAKKAKIALAKADKPPVKIAKAEPAVEEVETVTTAEASVVEETVETPLVETVSADDAVVKAPAVDEASPAETAADLEAKGDAEVADAKNLSVQTSAALNETKRADEAQQKINEDLERQ